MTSRGTVGIMAVGCGLSVANLYYNQPLLARMGDDFSVSDQQMGMVSTLGQVGYGLGLLLFVPLGDLVERRRLILIMLGATAAALAATAFAPSFFWLAVASFLLGAVTIVPQLIIPFAAGIAEPAERGKIVGAVMSGLLIGILLARTISGLVGSRLGWRGMYGIAASLMIGLMFAVRAWLPRSSPTVSGASYRSMMRSLVDLVHDLPVLRQSALFGALTFAAFSVFWTTLAFHLASPPFEYGSDVVGMFGLIGAAGAFAAPLIGAFADRRSARWTIGLGLTMTLGSFVVFGIFGRTLGGMIVGVLLLDLGVQCSHISNQTRIYSLLPEARSRLNTVYMVAFFFGGAFGSFAGALAWSRFGWTGVCLAGVVFLAVALAVFIATGEGRKPVDPKARPV